MLRKESSKYSFYFLLLWSTEDKCCTFLPSNVANIQLLIWLYSEEEIIFVCRVCVTFACYVTQSLTESVKKCFQTETALCLCNKY